MHIVLTSSPSDYVITEAGTVNRVNTFMDTGACVCSASSLVYYIHSYGHILVKKPNDESWVVSKYLGCLLESLVQT